jgi:hypothetical protein
MFRCAAKDTSEAARRWKYGLTVLLLRKKGGMVIKPST